MTTSEQIRAIRYEVLSYNKAFLTEGIKEVNTSNLFVLYTGLHATLNKISIDIHTSLEILELVVDMKTLIANIDRELTSRGN